MASLPIFDTIPAPRRPSKPALILVPTEAQPARLSAFDWSIVALAERDTLSSLREPGRLAKAMEMLFGLGRPNKLANGRNETLRRIAVWAWRRGWQIPKSEITEFLDAGFTLDQLELIQRSIARSRENHTGRRQGR
jgi:hypothetical protein